MKGFDMNPLPLFALAILAAVGLWWWLVPEPTRTLPVQPTEIEKREIRAAIKRYGNFMIVEEPGRRYMVTPKGKIWL